MKNPDPTHKLVSLCLNISPQAIATLVDWQKQCPDHDKIDSADLLRHPAVQSFLPETMPDLGLTPDEERSTYLSDLLLLMNPNERAWLMRLRATDWKNVDPGSEAHEQFHNGFIHRIPGRVMYALVKGSMLLQGCEPPADLNRKMNGARSMVERIQKQTQSNTLSPNVPPIHRPATPGSEGGAQ